MNSLRYTRQRLNATLCRWDTMRLTINNILIVVNRAVPHLVVSGDLRVSKVADIDDIGRGKAIGGDAGPFKLVDFVVHDDILLIVAIEDCALVDVSCARVADFADDVRDVCLVTHIKNC